MGQSPRMTKKSVNELAIFGGEPLYLEPLHVGRPNLMDREKFLQRVNDLLDRRMLTNYGPYVQEFERRMAELVGVRHCIAVCNATIGLEVVIRALGLSGEVITPSFTFIATAHSLQIQGIKPVFCDIDASTHNIDPNRIRECVSPRTTGIVGVHVWGRACEVRALSDIADEYGLKLYFDAAHALGCSYQGNMIGGFGEAEVFSFHATKFVNSFEGGMIATNNDELADAIRLMINFGFRGYDNVLSLGTNGKMSEISAAMGLTNLENLPVIVSKNRENYEHYRDCLKGLPGIELITYNEAEKNNYQYVVVEIDEEKAGISRDLLTQVFHAENILVRRYFYPGCHQMQPYRTLYPDAGLYLPTTKRLVQRVMTLPTGSSIDSADILTIVELLDFVLLHQNQIEEKLPQ
jgi:dTDP-4-amino-4,6-dideoxygalactose transaminase